MKAIIIFTSRYGSTEKIAKAIQTGIQDSEVQAECVTVENADVGSLQGFDLVCVGAPTEAFSASKPMKDFLNKLRGVNLTGKAGFAFDTKLDWRISGSAAKLIEKELKNHGMRLLLLRESALVSVVRDGVKIAGAVLEEGEAERFLQIGRTMGAALRADARPVPA